MRLKTELLSKRLKWLVCTQNTLPKELKLMVKLRTKALILKEFTKVWKELRKVKNLRLRHWEKTSVKWFVSVMKILQRSETTSKLFDLRLKRNISISLKKISKEHSWLVRSRKHSKRTLTKRKKYHYWRRKIKSKTLSVVRISISCISKS